MNHLPPDTTLPFFAYGALKENEISWPVISRFDHISEQVQMTGFGLALIDGLPTAIKQKGTSLNGYLIEFTHPEHAYAAISRFENVPNYYVWGSGVLPDGRVANLLVSKVDNLKTRHDLVSEWDSSQDPYFGYLIPLTFTKLGNLRRLRGLRMPGPDELFAFLELQMVFTSLWTLTERLYHFREGTRTSDETLSDICGRIGTKREWRDALDNAQITPNMGFQPNSDRYSGTPVRTGELGFPAWYRARNNIVHNGKGAQSEVGSLVRASIDMHNTLAILLQTISTAVRDRWRTLSETHTSEHTDWYFVLRHQPPAQSTVS